MSGTRMLLIMGGGLAFGLPWACLCSKILPRQPDSMLLTICGLMVFQMLLVIATKP